MTNKKRKIRIGMGIAAFLLLAALLCTVAFVIHDHTSFILLSLTIIPSLLYTVIRMFSPEAPEYGLKLPCILFAVTLAALLTLLPTMFDIPLSECFKLPGITALCLFIILTLLPCYGCELVLRSSVNLLHIAAAVTGMFVVPLLSGLKELNYIAIISQKIINQTPELNLFGYTSLIIGFVISAVMVLTALGFVLYYIMNAPSGTKLRKGFSSAATALISTGVSLPLWYIAFLFLPAY